jgi:hypothetical protein
MLTLLANGVAMKTLLNYTFSLVVLTCAAMSCYARDDIHEYPISDPMATSTAKFKLTDVEFYFGDSEFGAIEHSFGEFRTNKKTNAFGKSDKQACDWVFLSAVIQLHDRALLEGGNAVVNIRSNYRNRETSSESYFRCGAGNIIAGVALIGEVVTLEKQ